MVDLPVPPDEPGGPDLQLTEAVHGDVAPYEPGIALARIGSGVGKRFLPGAMLVYAPLFVIGAFLEPTIRALLLPGLLGLVGGLSLGFGLGLASLRRRLFPDANVDGRRALVAGVVSPFAVMAASAIVLPALAGLSDLAGLAALGGVIILVGFLLALAMFFPWLTPTPEDRRPSEGLTAGPDEPGAIPDGAS